MFSLRDLWQAYLSCRRCKRGTRDARRFDQHLIDHLVDIRQALADRQWRPRRADWFVTIRPKPREVHCADSADRVVHHWQEKLTGFHKRLWTRSKCGLALNLPQHEANRLRACTDGYLGHFRHASGWRLTHRILVRNPCLRVLFTLADGPRRLPRWQPRQANGLRGQWRWFCRHWPECLVSMQVGRVFECYEDQAALLGKVAGEHARPAERLPFPSARTSGLRVLSSVRLALRRRRVPQVFVAEQGHLRGGLIRRMLRLAWWPKHVAPPI